MIPLVDLNRQYRSISREVNLAIKGVFASGKFILGENLRAFEKEFAGYCRAKFAVGVGSGTEALHLSLLAAGVKPADEVITVANTAVPTISAIVLAQAKPVFVDIDPDTFTMDPAQIKKRITKKTKVILPVHLFGQMADMAAILKIARSFGLKVIEDAAQAHGAEFNGHKAGTMADMGCFSFYPTKNLGAYGDAGMAVTNNPVLARRLFLLRNYGETRRYLHILSGFNSRLDEIHAAVLRVKLKHLDTWNKTRRALAQVYEKHICAPQVLLPRQANGRKHIYHLYVIRCKNRNALQKFLRQNQIFTLIHYPIPVHLQPAYRFLNLKRGFLPKTEKVTKEILSLPMCPELSPVKVKFICAKINEFFRTR